LITLLEYFSEKKLFAIPWVLENVLAECAQHGYTGGFSFVENLAREQDLKLSAKVYCALVRGARNAEAATKVVAEVCANCASLDGILSCHNELLAVAFQKNCKNVLQLLDKMMAVGMKPNNVTCSILLKASDPTASSAILDKALGLVDAMDDDMDELLLVSVIEAHIRMGRSDLVRKTLCKQRASRSGLVKSPQAFASLIRASSFLQDIEGIRAIWRDLRTRHVELTSLLVGCMVEGLVQNAGPDDGHELIREIIGDPNTRALVNAVIYGSVIKGFSHQKRFDKVWAVYTEAVRENVSLTIATYNCLMDACARCNENSHIPALLEEMGKSGIQPNIITYSAIIKGYCQENRVDRGLELLEEMRTVAGLTPDERIYNTIINGCARQCLYDKGMSILEQMMAEGVAPSNFTLSVLVKLAGRARHLDRAFELCTELKEKFGVQPNVHVYNNLIQACIGQKSLKLDESVKLLKRMADERVRPDLRTYSLLLRALMMAGEGRQSVGLIRAAFGLDGIHPLLREVSPASLLQLREGLPGDLMGEVFDGLVKGREPDLAPELFEELRRFPNSKFDAKAALKIISAASGR
jgi:pentatricopeptide repeat protein